RNRAEADQGVGVGHQSVVGSHLRATLLLQDLADRALFTYRTSWTVDALRTGWALGSDRAHALQRAGPDLDGPAVDQPDYVRHLFSYSSVTRWLTVTSPRIRRW